MEGQRHIYKGTVVVLTEMVTRSEAESLNILKFRVQAQGIGCFVTASQVCIRTSDGS